MPWGTIICSIHESVWIEMYHNTMTNCLLPYLNSTTKQCLSSECDSHFGSKEFKNILLNHIIYKRRLSAALYPEKRKLKTQNIQLGSILIWYCHFHLKFPDGLFSVYFVTYFTILKELNSPENRHGAWRNIASLNPRLMPH